jgi:hypothetical protein
MDRLNTPVPGTAETFAQAALAALREADQHWQASARVAEELLERFDACGAVKRAGWHKWLPIAAALVIAAGSGVTWLARHPLESRLLNHESREIAVGEFVAWPGAAALPEFESGELVRTTLPVTVLPLLGIPPADAPGDGHVLADVLYGQDGQPRAVRVVGLQP